MKASTIVSLLLPLSAVISADGAESSATRASSDVEFTDVNFSINHVPTSLAKNDNAAIRYAAMNLPNVEPNECPSGWLISRQYMTCYALQGLQGGNRGVMIKDLEEKLIKVCLILTEDDTLFPPLKNTHFCIYMMREEWDERLTVKHNVENAMKDLHDTGLVCSMPVEAGVPPNAKGDEIRVTLRQRGYMMARERYSDSSR